MQFFKYYRKVTPHKLVFSFNLLLFERNFRLNWIREIYSNSLYGDWKGNLLAFCLIDSSSYLNESYNSLICYKLGQNWHFPFSGKINSIPPSFPKLLRKCPTFENRLSQNRVKKIKIIKIKNKNLEPYSGVLRSL